MSWPRALRTAHDNSLKLSSRILVPSSRPSYYRPSRVRSLDRPSISSSFVHHRTVMSQSPPHPPPPPAPVPSSPLLLKKPVKLACVQLTSGPDKAANLRRARDKVLEAAARGARIVVLPECFNSPYGCDYFPEYAEPLPKQQQQGDSSIPPKETSPSFHALRDAAREAGVYLIGGSIPEVCGEEEKEDGGRGLKTGGTQAAEAKKKKTKKYYNTSLTFSPDGALLAVHRKVHLFDIDIPGKISFHESDVLSPGDRITVAELSEYGRVGIAICYDVRFPELAMVAARAHGCFAMVYPGAFNTTTGPLHWELLARARAVDNQMYVAMCSPARVDAASYQAWGHSLVVDPLANVLATTGHGEDIVFADLDGEVIESARKAIPLRTQRRFDVYPDVSRRL